MVNRRGSGYPDEERCGWAELTLTDHTRERVKGGEEGRMEEDRREG